MTDLSTWELRGVEGYEWIVRPEPTSGIYQPPWQGVIRKSDGTFLTLFWNNDGGHTYLPGPNHLYDLVPPEPDWRHVRLLDGLLMQETHLTIATHRYDANKAKRGEPIVLEPV